MDILQDILGNGNGEDTPREIIVSRDSSSDDDIDDHQDNGDNNDDNNGDVNIDEAVVTENGNDVIDVANDDVGGTTIGSLDQGETESNDIPELTTESDQNTDVLRSAEGQPMESSEDNNIDNEQEQPDSAVAGESPRDNDEKEVEDRKRGRSSNLKGDENTKSSDNGGTSRDRDRDRSKDRDSQKDNRSTRARSDGMFDITNMTYEEYVQRYYENCRMNFLAEQGMMGGPGMGMPWGGGGGPMPFYPQGGYPMGMGRGGGGFRGRGGGRGGGYRR